MGLILAQTEPKIIKLLFTKHTALKSKNNNKMVRSQEDMSMSGRTFDAR